MKCISSCLPCLCGNRNSARITPSEPIQIVQANALKHHQRVDSGGGVNENDAGGNAGRINPNFNMGDEPTPSESELPVRALFIEVGKDRLLRVIHVKSKDDEDTPSGSKSTSPSSEESEGNHSPEKSPAESPGNQHAPNGGDDEEDEYWFSKWARKPRFRSIFAKNPNSRPKISENNNNSVGSSPEENNKISAELEMARAAAAAKRRAWAYNNNGSCESITQQPAANDGNDEEEFSSIAIVNTSKQQWSKTNSPEKELSSKAEASPFSSSVQQVEVAVEKHSPKEGIMNPAFQGDDDEDDDEVDDDRPHLPPDKTETEKMKDETTDPVRESKSKSSSISTASVKSRLSSNSEEEDAIISEPITNEKTTPSSSYSQENKKPASAFTTPLEESTLPPKKPLLFFIHSISGSSDVWHHQMEFFQNLGYEIVAPDLLGHGLSSTPLNPKYYYFESLVQDLILIFDHFTREDMKVVLVGHGYGACLAAMLTRVRLKNVALLISIAGGGPTPLVRRTCCQDSWFSWKCKLFHSNRIRGRFDNPEMKHILPPSIHENVLSGQVWQDGDSAFYRRVTVPTLLVYGMRDKVVTLVEECEMERTIPKSFLELIDSAGHMVMLNDPEKLNKMMCKFMQSWS